MEMTGKGDFDLNDEGNIEYYLNGSVDPFKYINNSKRLHGCL